MNWTEYVLTLLGVASVSWLIGKLAYWFIYERKNNERE